MVSNVAMLLYFIPLCFGNVLLLLPLSWVAYYFKNKGSVVIGLVISAVIFTKGWTIAQVIEESIEQK